MRIAFERMAEGSPRRGHRHCVKLFEMERREVSVGAEGLVGHPGEGEWRRHVLSSLRRHCCSGWLLPGFRQLSVAGANSSVYRQLGRAAAASIATSRALGWRGEVEWRARACNLSAPGKWRGRALLRVHSWASRWIATRSAGGRRSVSTGGTTTFMCSPTSSLLFLSTIRFRFCDLLDIALGHAF